MEHEITISEFNQLQEAVQHEAIWRHGFIMGKKIEGEYEIILYRVFSFYVEIYYNIKLNFLKKVKTLSTVENLDAYNFKRFNAYSNPSLIK
jgi:hypothetical protein